MMFVLYVIEEVCRLQSYTITYGLYFPYIYGLILLFLCTSIIYWQVSYIRKNIPFLGAEKNVLLYQKKTFTHIKDNIGLQQEMVWKTFVGLHLFLQQHLIFHFLQKHKQVFRISLDCVSTKRHKIWQYQQVLSALLTTWQYHNFQS